MTHLIEWSYIDFSSVVRPKQRKKIVIVTLSLSFYDPSLTYLKVFFFSKVGDCHISLLAPKNIVVRVTLYGYERRGLKGKSVLRDRHRDTLVKELVPRHRCQGPTRWLFFLWMIFPLVKVIFVVLKTPDPVQLKTKHIDEPKVVQKIYI